MKSSEHEQFIVFANCSGGARHGLPRPDLLGTGIRHHPSLTEKSIIAVAVCEAMLTYPARQRPQITKIGSMGEPVRVNRFEWNGLGPCFLHDHDLVSSGLGGEWQQYYLSHLNSEDHRNVCAINGKWMGREAVPRLQQQFAQHMDLVANQGLGLLLKQPPLEPPGILGVLLRPAGIRPEENGKNDPMLFWGNRDTEPRVMAVVPTQIFGQEVDLAFCQLETHSTDNRLWEAGDDRPVGSLHREAQIRAILEHFNRMKSKRIILLGDFNARPGWPELTLLSAGDRFRQVMPEKWPKDPATWGAGLAYNGPLAPPEHNVSEKERGRPYTHSRHGVLIDHAFVRGFDESWGFRLEVLKSPKMENQCITDHCPIALSVIRARIG